MAKNWPWCLNRGPWGQDWTAGGHRATGGLVRGRVWGSRVKGVISRNILVGRDGEVAGGSGLMCWWPGHSGQNCAIAESAM